MEPASGISGQNGHFKVPHTKPRLKRAKSEAGAQTTIDFKRKAVDDVKKAGSSVEFSGKHALNLPIEQLVPETPAIRIKRNQVPTLETAKVSSFQQQAMHGMRSSSLSVSIFDSSTMSTSSSRTPSLDGSTSRRQSPLASGVSDIAQRDGRLMSIIKLSDDWDGLLLASPWIIETDKLFMLLEEAFTGELQKEHHQSLIQFCCKWLKAFRGTDEVRKVKGDLSLLASDDVLSALFKESLTLEEEVVFESSISKPAKEASIDFSKIIAGVCEKERSNRSIELLADDLTQHQAHFYSTLLVPNVLGEIPQGLKAYSAQNKALSLFFAAVVQKQVAHHDLLIKFLLKLAKSCLGRGDLETTACLWDALYSDVCKRFTGAWKEVQKEDRYRKISDEFMALFSTENGYQASMNYMRKNRILVPYLAPFLYRIGKIKEEESVIEDRHGLPCYNMEKLERLRETIDLFLYAQLQSKEALPHTNLHSRYLIAMRPLGGQAIRMLSSKEDCLPLSAYQRWELKTRGDKKVLKWIEEAETALREKKIIEFLIANTNDLFSPLCLACEAIIEPERLFALIAKAIKGDSERQKPLLSFCNKWVVAHMPHISPNVDTELRLITILVQGSQDPAVKQFCSAIVSKLETCAHSDDSDLPIQETIPFTPFQTVDPHAVAIGLYSHLKELFLQLEPSHFISKRWKVRKEIIEKIEKHADNLSWFVVDSTLQAKDKKEAIHRVLFFIELAKITFDERDYMNSSSIFSALTKPQLQKLMNEPQVGKSFRQKLAGCAEAFDLFSDNFTKLRSAQRQTKYPYIPNLMLIRKDMKGCEEMPDIVEEDGEDPEYNINKVVRIKAILDAFFAFKPLLEATSTSDANAISLEYYEPLKEEKRDTLVKALF